MQRSSPAPSSTRGGSRRAFLLGLLALAVASGSAAADDRAKRIREALEAPQALGNAAAVLGDEVLVFSLSPRSLGRAPRVDIARVASVLEKPRRLLATTPALPHALGGLVLTAEGPVKLLGVLVALPDEEA